MFQVVFRELLSPEVVAELDQSSATLNGYVLQEHDDEGSHTDVTANSVTIRPDGVLTFPNGDTAEAALDDSLTVTTPEGWQFTDGVSDLLGIGRASAGSGSSTTQNTSGADLVALARLVGGPIIDVGDWSSGDAFGTSPTEGRDANSGLNRVIYRAQPAADRDIRSLYKPNTNAVTGCEDGQIVVVVNDSVYTVTCYDRFASGGTGGAGQSFVINGPVAIGPQGAAVLVYDESYNWPSAAGFGGWRVVAATHVTGHPLGATFTGDVTATGGLFEEGLTVPIGRWQSYTPTFSSTGTQPTNFTVTGRYTKTDDTYIVEASVVMGGSFTAGTGLYQISLPVTMTTPANAVKAVGPAMIFDNDTGEYWSGVVRQNAATTVTIVPDGSRAPIGPAVPITFAASDQIGFRMILERA